MAETGITATVHYLYPSSGSGLGGLDCLGEYRDEEQGGEDNGWLYYLYDATRHVRQGVDADGELVSTWHASQ